MSFIRVPLGVLLLALQEQTRLPAERIDAASLNKAADAAAADYAKSNQQTADLAAAAMSAVHVAESACGVNPAPAPASLNGTIGHAVDLLLRGSRVCRRSWPAGVFLELDSDVIFLSLEYVTGRNRWRPEECDILAKDWTLA